MITVHHIVEQEIFAVKIHSSPMFQKSKHTEILTSNVPVLQTAV